MRVSELNLVAFGPFSERLLSFGKTGLHIVYGPNEAGKSSALRALKYLLYGIPERTTLFTPMTGFGLQGHCCRMKGTSSG